MDFDPKLTLFLPESFLYHLIYKCYSFLNICNCCGEDSTARFLEVRPITSQLQMAVLYQRTFHATQEQFTGVIRQRRLLSLQ
ncbi:hypothetical protein I79_009426 [Cricetulus griseus]|uniref:Uncharacterized protein n=1 Tax=Cricetulus griseus TaxID=10029 RepID=G3HFR2_CRIGR|nr:hypothetical protein I79_009426 [Cricetulus griseus]